MAYLEWLPGEKLGNCPLGLHRRCRRRREIHQIDFSSFGIAYIVDPDGLDFFGCLVSRPSPDAVIQGIFVKFVFVARNKGIFTNVPSFMTSGHICEVSRESSLVPDV